MVKNIQDKEAYIGIRVCKAAVTIIDFMNCLKEDDLDTSNNSSGSSSRR